MRELKFRAWDRIKRKMLYGVSPFNVHITDENEPLLSLEYSKHDDCEFEQYTGLKDKNGKEIYEGDIVKLTGKVAKNKSTIYKVVWDSFLTGYDLISLERGKADVGYLNEVAMEERYDVIGNIHENPELLKKEK